MASTMLLLFALTSTALSQYTQTLTDDGNGNSIYVPTAGSTSSVAVPAATPTIIYNCQQMPLICENVASWANSNGGTNGDLANAPLLYFDPDPGHKEGRRRTSCGCFDHDGCSNANSNGKRQDKITDIATSTVGAIPAISPNPSNIILAGVNPGLDSNGNPNPRVPLQSIPGRFFGQGTSFSCDEFPAAPFIQGGTGAKTICAMHAWSIYQAANPKDQGKWPLPPGSGTKWEQDWQARLHDFLRKFFGIAGSKGANAKRGWETVYPFYVSTTTLPASSGKGFLVIGQSTSKTVLARNAMPATRTLENSVEATYVVSGDDEVDKVQGRVIARKHGNQIYANAPRGPVSIPVITPAPVLLNARQDSTGTCSAPFEQSGAEDIEAGDAGFDDPIDDDLSKAECSPADVDPKDLQDAIDSLNALGDNGYQYDNCCGGPEGICSQVAINGTAIVGLCGSEECIGCAQLANYVQGIHDTCAGDDGVGGKQAINESDDLTVEISLDDTT